ncbi:MAG: hypothetical protein JSV00_03905, partial [bacterium]
MTRSRILTSGVLLAAAVMAAGCWIPLPEETAIVVEVLDARGGPVDGVEFSLDGTETLITGSQVNEGQVFKSLSTEGLHTLQMVTSSLIDPQGGVGWIPLASQISGELLPISFANRPFAGGSDVLLVPVNKGEITVVTVHLADSLASPADNQWLTDGSNPSPYRLQDNVDEFRDSPEPVFWWRADPSLGATVTFTFQLWADDDGDTRYPLRVANPGEYIAAMNQAGPAFRQPDWQVPLAGLQRAESGGVNRLTLWSSQASDPSSPVKYDLYYAPASRWDDTDWEKNPVLRDLSPEAVPDGTALQFRVGAGTPNSGAVLRNGVPHTLALRARDGVSNLDTTGRTSRRTATPAASGSALASISGLSAFADSSLGGQVLLSFDCVGSVSSSLRVFAAPQANFGSAPFDTRFIRAETACAPGPVALTLNWLVNGVTYALGVESYDSVGNAGPASAVVTATPSSAAAADTVPPTTPTITVTRTGPGQVGINVSAVSDAASSVIRRVSWAPAVFTNATEAMLFTDLAASPSTTITLSDIPNGVPYNFAVRAIDAAGNSSFAATQVEFTDGSDTLGPTWASDDAAFFSTFSYSSAGSVWPLGASWKYSGFALGRNPSLGQGEYVWRVIQENTDRGVSIATKLGAFYTYSGYYSASTQTGSLDMSGVGPSADVGHREVFGFVEGAIASADVIGSPFDSTAADRFRQRPAAVYGGSLAAGSGTTNQLVILYNTDEDGVAVVSEIISPSPGFAGIMKVVA